MTVWLAEPFPTIELFLVVGLKKEIPLTLNPCFCLCKGLSGLLWDQDNGWRPGIESLVAHPQQEPLLSPRLQTCFQTATCYFPLYSCPFDSNWGGREGRAVKQGLPMIIARYMKLFISWSLSYAADKKSIATTFAPAKHFLSSISLSPEIQGSFKRRVRRLTIWSPG